jgi:hypothetical protein
LRAADKDDISYSDFVTRLVRAQFQARQEGALEWRMSAAPKNGAIMAGRKGPAMWLRNGQTPAQRRQI